MDENELIIKLLFLILLVVVILGETAIAILLIAIMMGFIKYQGGDSFINAIIGKGYAKRIANLEMINDPQINREENKDIEVMNVGADRGDDKIFNRTKYMEDQAKQAQINRSKHNSHKLKHLFEEEFQEQEEREWMNRDDLGMIL